MSKEHMRIFWATTSLLLVFAGMYGLSAGIPYAGWVLAVGLFGFVVV